MLPILTKREKEVLQFIKNFIKQNGFSPSTREVAHYFGIAPKNAHKHIKNLELKGYLNKTKNISRGISLNIRKVPLISTVPAGAPDLFHETAEEYYEVDSSLFPYQNIILVRVFGDSMINAHIESGDIAIVAVDVEINSGDIVVASIFNELTLKRYLKQGNKIVLHPENENYQDIILSDLNQNEIKIVGKVVGVMRKLS